MSKKVYPEEAASTHFYYLSELFSETERRIYTGEPLPLPPSADGSESIILEYSAQRTEFLRAAYENVGRQLLQAFVPSESIASEEGQRFLRHYAAVAALGSLARNEVAALRYNGKSPSGLAHADWRPMRSTVVRIITGAFLTVPDASQPWKAMGMTAALMNRGMGRERNLSASHIRNALNSFVLKDGARILQQAADVQTAALEEIAQEWSVLNGVWLRARDYYKPEHLTLHHLRKATRSRLIFDWRREAEQDPTARLSISAVCALDSRAIKEWSKLLQARRAA
ncbi:hypothetical protein SAMN02983003_3872 [Devosia enhydra]|uniref:Uncharacterized protein n=1 Tax=Devosia enhydra TaxID=665118 RepID=A0A1K2I2R6_9HYPH|nr:hypothetical protein [Devosia enhydra]SFZ86678.1 hypothetical protein SAMN02983003_3872 [Devosia enhydra]